MSHYMTALAMKQSGIKPAAKIVLYWLADHHNGETGRCFPSLKTLERECEMSRPAIIRHLSALEDAGLISRDQRKRDNGSQTSTAYKLHLVPVTKCNTPCYETLQPPVTNQYPLNLGTINLGIEQERKKRVTAPRTGDDDLIAILSNSVSADVAASFVQHRKDLKKPMTENMANAILKKLEGHHAPDEVLTDSIANGWQGIFPEKIKNGGHNGKSTNGTQTKTYTRGDAQFDEARERALRIASRPRERGFDSF